MSLFKKFLGRKIFELSRNEDNVRFFSVHKCNKNFKNLGKINCMNERKMIPKTEGQFDIENRNIEQTVGIIDGKKKNEKPKCVKKGTLSIAIVGGGYTCISTSILLKQNPAIKDIRLIDMDNTLEGSVCDLGQIDTSTNIKHYKKNSILDGLHNVHIVALMDETYFPRGKRGLFSQFMQCSSYIKSVANCSMNACPNALIAVFARPVTATVPLVSKIYEYSGNYNPNKIIGSVALESMRISAMVATFLDLNPSFVSVPITGGVDSVTIVPLLSRTRPFNHFTEAENYILTQKLRSADKILSESEIKSPTISSGLAAAKFISVLINGLKGQENSIASAYIKSNIFPPCQYITTELQFGPDGIKHNFGLPKISCQEIHLIEQASPMMNRIVDTINNLVLTKGMK